MTSNRADVAMSCRAPKRRSASGFTTMELMLSLGIVAVLAVVAMNVWSGWRARVAIKQAQDDIVAISAVVDAYWQDTQGYPASLAAIGRGGLRDPWGNAYQYLRLGPTTTGQARKDHSLVPLNSDYDLYSMGPDGRSSPPLTARNSRDDILRANNGRFVGPASSY